VPITAIAASPAGQFIVAFSDGTGMTYTRSATMSLSGQRSFSATIRGVAIAPALGRTAVALSDSTVHIMAIDLSSALTLNVPALPASVSFSVDGATVLAGCSDGSVRLWSAATGSPLSTLALPGGAIVYAAFTEDGSRLAAMNSSGNVRVFRSTDLGVAGDLASMGWDACAISPTGEFLAVGIRATGSIRVYRVEGMELIKEVEASGGLTDLTFSGDNRTLLATGTGVPLRRWYNLNDRVTTNPTFVQGFTAVATSEQGTTFALCRRDGRIEVWAVSNDFTAVEQ
jgi:WD40 repeat protein